MARTAAERFSIPQLALTGANHPGTSRLYELMVGFSSSDAAGKCSTTPAIAAENTGGNGPARSVTRKAFLPSRQQDRWMCPLEPSSPAAVLARKLARKPSDEARPLTASLVRVASSAARRPGRA